MSVAIYNPTAGDGVAKAFFCDHVLPLLAQHGRSPDRVIETTHAGHAGEIVVDVLESTSGEVTVVLGSGDGTLHEIINHLSNITFKGSKAGVSKLPRISFALVPCGTANALFYSLFPLPDGSQADVAHKLKSVRSFVDSGSTVPLQVIIGSLSFPPKVKKPPQFVISSVVMSTSLHASILHDSESLRSEIPGMDRFKVAAQKNSTKWYNSSAKLLPLARKGVVQIYDPHTKSFINHPESTLDDPIIDLDGPFVYFLSTVNVDRLEPSFVISPLARTIPPTEASCDVVIVRPLRDPSLTQEDAEARNAFKDKLWGVLGSAYKAGSHINLRFDDKGNFVEIGDGETVVEYVRCGGWEWIPDDLDEAAHLLCSDGAIFHIEKGGRAVCSAAVAEDHSGFAVYA